MAILDAVSLETSSAAPPPPAVPPDLAAARARRRLFVILAAAMIVVISTTYLGLQWIEAARPLWTEVTAESLLAALPRSGRPAQAIYRLESLAARDGWDGDRLRLAGDLYRELGDVRAAAAYWERAAAYFPNDPVLLRRLADVYLEIGEWTRAADILAHLRAVSPDSTPDDTWAAFQLGLIRASVSPSAADDLRAAMIEPAYERIASQLIGVLSRPDDPLRVLRAGIVMADAELWSAAELAFSYAASDPDPSVTALALAYGAFARDKQGKDGSLWINQAVTLAPDDARVRYLLGLHLRATRDFEGSLRALAAAAALDPSRPEIYAELGTAYWLTGDRVTGEYWLRHAIELSDGDPRYQTVLDSLLAEEANLLESLGIDLEATAESTPDTLNP